MWSSHTRSLKVVPLFGLDAVSESPVLARRATSACRIMRIAMCANVLKTVEHLLIPQGLFENLHPLLTVKILRFEGNLFYVKGLTATVTIWYIKDKVFPIHAKKAQLYGFSTSTLPLCPFSMRLGGLQNRSGHFDNIKMQYALSSFQFFFFFLWRNSPTGPWPPHF